MTREELEQFVEDMKGLLTRCADDYADGGEGLPEILDEIKERVNKLPCEKKVGELWVY